MALTSVELAPFASLQVGPRSADLKKLKSSKIGIDDLASAFNDSSNRALRRVRSIL